MLVIITGATGGLGKAYVEECARQGYDIILSATKQERLENLMAETNKKYPNITIYAKECKLDNKESRQEFYKFINENNLKPDMLINNAGYILEGSVLRCEHSEIQSSIDVNITGTMELTYWFLKQESEKKKYLLIVSSMAGYYPMPQMAPYAATKSYLTNMAVSLRQELKKKVNVSCVCPGSMSTSDAMKRSIKSQGLGGRLSLQKTSKVAKISIKNVLKNKAVWVPGFFNKMMVFASKIFPKTLIAKVVHSRWSKCEKKRGEYR